MLMDGKVVATVASDDIAAARSFYTDRLGLPELMASDDGVGYILPDGSAMQVYLRPDHRAAENTAIRFIVADFDAEVEELRQRGITSRSTTSPGSRPLMGSPRTSVVRRPRGSRTLPKTSSASAPCRRADDLGTPVTASLSPNPPMDGIEPVIGP